MIKNIMIILTVLVIYASFVRSHQANPFQPYQYYLKSTEKFGVLAKEDVKYRLGTETKPHLYDINLKFTITEGPVFDGEVKITFQATKAGVTTVVLNGENIEVKSDAIKIYREGSSADNLYQSHTYDPVYQKFTFITKSALQPLRDYVIILQYKGQLKEDFHGVYLSEYKQETNTKKLITTHFGQFARRMMPCWDEPQFKAKFKFTVTRDANMKTYSNAVRDDTASTGNVDVFKTTSEISPYILALVVSDFDRRENKDEKFGVIARPNAINDTAYALEVGPKLIKALDEWTDMPYHKFAGVDKMELGAIPDFLAVSDFIDNEIFSNE